MAFSSLSCFICRFILFFFFFFVNSTRSAKTFGRFDCVSRRMAYKTWTVCRKVHIFRAVKCSVVCENVPSMEGRNENLKVVWVGICVCDIKCHLNRQTIYLISTYRIFLTLANVFWGFCEITSIKRSLWKKYEYWDSHCMSRHCIFQLELSFILSITSMAFSFNSSESGAAVCIRAKLFRMHK